MSDNCAMPLSIRLLNTVSEIELGCNFFKSVWGGEAEVVPADIAIASGHAGGYFSGGFDSDGNLVAASYAFVGRHQGLNTLHSHVTASRLAGAGFQLKQHQREWAAGHGVDAITWTFDPLVRRNCVFNLEKLVAPAIEYLVNFYGVMHDDLNAGDESDRLLALWPTAAPKLRDAFAPVGATAIGSEFAISSEAALSAISIGSAGQPVLSPEAASLISSRKPFAVYLPPDIERLRQTNIEAAKSWRNAVREVLHPSFESGAQVRRMFDNRAALFVEWPTKGE